MTTPSTSPRARIHLVLRGRARGLTARELAAVLALDLETVEQALRSLSDQLTRFRRVRTGTTSYRLTEAPRAAAGPKKDEGPGPKPEPCAEVVGITRASGPGHVPEINSASDASTHTTPRPALPAPAQASDAPRAGAAGRWFITEHALRHFAQIALGWKGDGFNRFPEDLRRRALTEIIRESQAAHLVRMLPRTAEHPPSERWRGPKPRRLRYVVGAGQGHLHALLTVLPACDERGADRPEAWEVGDRALLSYVEAVGVHPRQARRSIQLDLEHARRVGGPGGVEAWQGPEPTRARYEVRRRGNVGEVVGVRFGSGA